MNPLGEAWLLNRAGNLMQIHYYNNMRVMRENESSILCYSVN